MEATMFEDPDGLAEAGDAAVDHHGRTPDLLAAAEDKTRIAAAITDATAGPRDDDATAALDLAAVAAVLPAGCTLMGASVYGAGHDERAVSVVFEAPSGRTGRGVIPYSEVQ